MASSSIRSGLRSLAHGLAIRCGVEHMIKERRLGHVLILTLHNFTAAQTSGFFGEQPIGALKRFLSALQQQYTVSALSDAYAYLQSGERSSARPMAALTVDDGYADNFEILHPALREFNIPAAFFVTTSFIDGGAPPWPVEIAAILRASLQTNLQWPIIHPTRTIRQKKQAAALLKQSWRGLTGAQRSEHIDRLRADLSVQDYVRPLPMTWDQLRALRSWGHTIGSHTVHHGILTDLPDVEVKQELSVSKARLEDELKAPCEFFAYPNGDADDRTAKLVADAGYTGGLTQDACLCRPGQNPYRLPRVNLPPYESAMSLRYRLTAI